MRFLFPITLIQPGQTNKQTYEPFGLGRFATDRSYAPQVNGRYAALLLTNSILLVCYFGIDGSSN